MCNEEYEELRHYQMAMEALYWEEMEEEYLKKVQAELDAIRKENGPSQ